MPRTTERPFRSSQIVGTVFTPEAEGQKKKVTVFHFIVDYHDNWYKLVQKKSDSLFGSSYLCCHLTLSIECGITGKLLLL